MSVRSERIASYLDAITSIAPLVRADATEAERSGRLSDRVVEGLHETGLFRIAFPDHFRGGGLVLPESLRVFEAAARVDGSFGWCLTIGSGSGMIGSWLEPSAFEALASEPRAVAAGSLGPIGTRAVATEGGYRYTGKGAYASCSSFCTHVMMNGIAMEDGEPRMLGPVPEARIAFIPSDQVTFLDTWRAGGLAATASNDMVYQDVFVPAGSTFPSLAGRVREDGERRGPGLMNLLGAGLAAVSIGTAQHALDALVELATVKIPAGMITPLREKPQAQMAVGRAEALLQAARAYLHQVVDEAWHRDVEAITPTPQEQARVRLGLVTATQLAVQAVDLVYEAGGITSISLENDIERAWRDTHAVTRHFHFDTSRYGIAGRVYLGLEPGVPFI